jgi:hypothetical protein
MEIEFMHMICNFVTKKYMFMFIISGEFITEWLSSDSIPGAESWWPQILSWSWGGNSCDVVLDNIGLGLLLTGHRKDCPTVW